MDPKTYTKPPTLGFHTFNILVRSNRPHAQDPIHLQAYQHTHTLVSQPAPEKKNHPSMQSPRSHQFKNTSPPTLTSTSSYYQTLLSDLQADASGYQSSKLDKEKPARLSKYKQLQCNLTQKRKNGGSSENNLENIQVKKQSNFVRSSVCSPLQSNNNSLSNSNCNSPKAQQKQAIRLSKLNLSVQKTYKTLPSEANTKRSIPYSPLRTIYESRLNNRQLQSRDASISNLLSPKRQIASKIPKKSNKKLIINALKNCCFPGQINRKQREKYQSIIQNSANQYFLFLFKQSSRKVLKGVYFFDNSTGKVKRVCGDRCPEQIYEEDVLVFYRYDSGAKEFKTIKGCRTFSISIHGICIR